MNAEPQAPDTPKCEPLESWLKTVISLLEYEHEMRPERRVRHLIEQGKEFLRTLNGES
jgi:hypothetical protein